ncbi:MAG TPA: polyprenyl synthetase family protein [Puia sp.]|nr:polyprenyl synthetase family protein [Puia sp.]
MRFQQLSKEFNSFFNKKHFPERPETLYGAASYMIGEGGKRIRPVLCLLGNEIFGTIQPDTWITAAALEIFHNFTLIHDDIMDKAPLRRGRATVHAKYNEATALLAGDVMLLQSYEYLNQTSPKYVQELFRLLNKTGREVCEGQQLDMDFEKTLFISLDQYLHMIELKTAVFLAASLRMGAIIGGASEENQENIYAFGKNLGLAFQVQDDWLDSFGNPSTFGKQKGGDIISNKKTFLLVQALENAGPLEKQKIQNLLQSDDEDKIERMIEIFHATGADQAAEEAKMKYMEKAEAHLELITVPFENKVALKEIAAYLLQREI